MQLNHFLFKWERLWTRLPSFENLPAVAKPTQIATVETVVNEYTGEQLIAFALANTDLFGNAELNAEKVQALDPKAVLDYYLNVRFGLPVDEQRIPIRRAHQYSSNPYLYGWYILMSAVMTRIYELTYSTIDPHKKYRAEQLMRTIRQLNFIIRTMTEEGVGTTNPNTLIVAVAKITSVDGERGSIYLDTHLWDAWVAEDRTAQMAWDHWQTNKTQPVV